jgi:predicted acylesterase/phospholipase RssA
MAFRVLSVDGGGMRGVYSAAYLTALEEGFRKRLGAANELDLGKAFDLVVGTSTGAIIGIGLAAGLGPSKIQDLYRQHGSKIFPRMMPSGFGLKLFWQLHKRPAYLESGDNALNSALTEAFKEETLGELWKRRAIAIAIPAVNMGTHRSWVFKTPHDPKTNHRDDDYTLVDVCRATSAAPLFRSLAAITTKGSKGPPTVFTDGGLWANNPVLVALTEALNILERRADPSGETPIEIYCLGSCGKPEGDQISAAEVHRGLAEWKFGGEAAKVSLDAQEFAYDFVSRAICQHLRRKVRIVRFPADKIPASLMDYLDLDEVRPHALDALVQQARQDASMTNSQIMNKTGDGPLIEELFMSMTSR